MHRPTVQTGCPNGHDRAALCCKTDSELRFFLEKSESYQHAGTSGLPSYWCHFDDGELALGLRIFASTSSPDPHRAQTIT
jgi:hypothetical protein